jgi:hypothetical protein
MKTAKKPFDFSKTLKGIVLSIGATEDEHEFVKATMTFGRESVLADSIGGWDLVGDMTFDFKYGAHEDQYSVTVRANPSTSPRRDHYTKAWPEFRYVKSSVVVHEMGIPKVINHRSHGLYGGLFLSWGIEWPVLATAQVLNDTLGLGLVRKGSEVREKKPPLAGARRLR